MSQSVLEKELTNPEVRLAFEQDWLHQEFVTQLEHKMDQAMINRKMLADKMGKAPAFITKAMRFGHNLTANSMVHMAFAAGFRISLTLSPFVAHELPQSYGPADDALHAWQDGSIIYFRVENDNSRKPKAWDEVDDELEFSAAAA